MARSVDEESQRIDLDDYPVPEAVEADEDDVALYDSERDYDDQLDAYKAFQRRTEQSAVSAIPSIMPLTACG
jgi:hypothetical protein